MLRWLMKREERYKTSLDRLEKENEQLQYVLAATQRERERDELLNNDKGKKVFNFLKSRLCISFHEHNRKVVIKTSEFLICFDKNT